MADQPTILIGSLNDAELKQSIDKLVEHVNVATRTMVTNFDQAVNNMKRKLQELGNTNVNMGGTADGGSSRRASSQAKERQAVKETTVAYDQMTNAMQKATGTKDTIVSTFTTQIGIYKEELKQAQQQIEAFKVMARRGAETGDKGLFVFATTELHKYEDQVAHLTAIIPALENQMKSLNTMLAPQGHAFENYVNSIGRATPEMQLLNEQYKRGASLMAEQKQGAREYSAEITRMADEIRKSAEWQERGSVMIGQAVVYKKDEISIEEQLAKIAKERGESIFQATKATEQEVATTHELNQEAKKLGDNFETVHSMAAKANIRNLNSGLGMNAQDAQYLREHVASLLQVEDRQVQMVNTEIASYNQLDRYLKQLQASYRQLGADRIAKGEGTDIATEIQRVQRAMQKLQETQTRPVSLQAAMGLEEKSLDDIAYKIKQLQLYQRGLDVSNKQGEQEFRAVGKAISDLQQRQNKLMRGQQGLIQSNNALTRSFNYMKNRLAFMFTVGGTTQFVKQLAEVRGEYEMTERALGVLVSSAQRGTQIFQELSQMALVSPYTLIELSNAAKQLTAYDVAARDVVDTTRRLADISAAVGAPVERLTYALGQIKAYEYLNSRDARIFANAGIPLVKQLSQYYSELEGNMVSVGDVYDRIKKKAVSYNDVMGVLTRMTDQGGRFFDYQAKVADTLKVQLANLTLAWNNMLNEIGKAESGLLSGSVKSLKNIFIQWKNISKAANNLLITYGLFKGVQSVFLIFAQRINNEKIREMFLNEKLAASYKKIGESMGTVISKRSTWVGVLLLAIESVVAMYIRANREIRAFNKSISENAKESAKNLKEFLGETSTAATRSQAQSGKLAPTDAEKAWETIREEIENSSAAASAFIPQLMQIEDVNERVTQAFAVADKIHAAQDALSDLYDEMKVTDAPGWYRFLFGDKDSSVAQALEEYEKIRRRQEEHPNLPFAVEQANDIAYNKIATFVEDAANLIRDNLGEEGVKDATKVTEAWAQILRGFYQQYPDLSKSARNDFDYWANELFARRFEGVFDKGALAQEKFFNLLKKNSASVFANITENFMTEQGGLTIEQQTAINNAAEQMGAKWKEVFWQSMNDGEGHLDSKKLERSIIAAFGVVDRNAIQREFDRVFLSDRESPKYGAYQRQRVKDSEETLAWEKRLADEEDDLRKKIEQVNYMLEKRNSLDGDTILLLEEQKGEYNDTLTAIKDVQEYFGLRNKAQIDADKKAGKSSDDLSDAIKKEIELVNDIKKRYEEYRKMGYSTETAMAKASKEYNKTLDDTNAKLKRLGIITLSAKDIATKSTSEILQFYTTQLGQVQATARATSVLTYDAAKEEMSEVEGIDKALVEATKRFEGFRADVYKDAAGVKTQGYGHSEKAPTIATNPILDSMTVTKEEAHRIMMEDYAVIKEQTDDVIAKLIASSPDKYAALKEMTVSQYDALLDFTYQYGRGGLNKLLSQAGDDVAKIAEALFDPSKVGLGKDWAQIERREWRRAMFAGDAMTVDATLTEIQGLIKAGKDVEAIEALEKAIASFGVTVTSEDFENRLSWLNGMLSDLKESYELAKEMKDNPALSHVFADMLGLTDDDVQNLPKNATQVINRINTLLEAWAFDSGVQKAPNIWDVLNVADLDKYIRDNKIEGEFEKFLRDAVKMANELRLNEAKAQIDDWNKLLEKYAEYEYKRTEIIKQAEREREAARKNGATQDIFNAIDKGERRQLASLDFEQFQKSNLWLTATGDLATLTDGALRGLIDALDEYKNKAQDLDPKEIKNINSALRKMHKELRRGNPFTAIAEAIDDAKERAADFQDEINETEIKMTELWQKISSGQGTKEDMAMLDTLADKLAYLKKVATEAGKVSPTALVSGINDAIAVARTATNEFKELANALGGKGMTDAAENLEHTMNIIESAGQGAAIGAQFSGWGALIGAVAGGLKGVIVEFADEWSGNKGITEQIKESNRELTRMGQLLDDVSWHANKTYGVMKSGMQGVQAQVKKWQMVELERQLALEQSRKAKNKDEDEIMRLQGEIASLRREIDDLYDSSVNTMLGISDWGGQIETMVGAMIDAFRNGEDAMVAFSEKWDEMIDNIILKLLVSQYVQRAWDEIQKTLEEMEADITSTAKEAVAQSKDENRMMSEWLVEKGYAQWIGETGRTAITATEEELERIQEEWINERKAYLAKRQQQAEDQLKNAEEKYYEKSIDYLMGEGKQSVEAVLDPLYEKIKDLYDYGDKGNKQLSLLQQGIQGITEETAGALEAMLNGISQQIYLHTDIMLRIEQSIQDLDLSVGAAVNSQILLQLQSSYQTQEAIRSTLEGWSSPSGLSVRVQMVE